MRDEHNREIERARHAAGVVALRQFFRARRQRLGVAPEMHLLLVDVLGLEGVHRRLGVHDDALVAEERDDQVRPAAVGAEHGLLRELDVLHHAGGFDDAAQLLFAPIAAFAGGAQRPVQLAGFAAKLDDLPPRLRHGFVDPFVRAGAHPFEFGDLPVELGQVLAERFNEVVHRGPPRFEVLDGEFALALEAFVRLGAFLPEAGFRLLTELVIAGLQRGQCGTLEAFFQRLADGFQLPGACFVRFLDPRGFGAGFRELRLDLCRGLTGFPPFADAIFFHRGDALVAFLNRRLGTGHRVVPQSVAFARDYLDDGGARRGVVGPPDEAPDGDEEPRTQQDEDDEGVSIRGCPGGVSV